MKNFTPLVPFPFLLALGVALGALAAAQGGSSSDPDADYDRLDGKGPSTKKVHVIEWEGNLEIHVYPQGSLTGLALKLDKRNKDRPVMVIGYRFDNAPKQQLIRRAILSIDLREGFKTYKDPSVDGYDKIVISNNGLSGQVAAFKLDPEPTQLYPDGHPALATAGKDDPKPRKPAGQAPADEPSEDYGRGRPPAYNEDGSIRPFSW